MARDAGATPSAQAVAVGESSWRRSAHRVTGALPLVWMALLAAATWWLVTRAGPADEQHRTGPARHQADYTMQRIAVQRYDPTGRLKAEIEGDVLRHYPDMDTYEIDNVRVNATLADGHALAGSALRSVSNGDGSDVQLVGSAHVQRIGAAGDAPIDFRSEFLDVQVNAERVRSHVPVHLTQGAMALDADAMDYDNLTQVAKLRGRVRATFPMTTTSTAAQRNRRVTRAKVNQ